MGKDCLWGREAASHLIRGRLAGLLAHVDAARGEDPDGIHDLRVASRRLRAALAAHRDRYPREAVAQALEQVGTITRALGLAREMDVSMALLAERKAKLHGPARLAAGQVVKRMGVARAQAAAAVAQAAARPGTHEFLECFIVLFENPRSAPACYMKGAGRMMRARYRTARDMYLLWKSVPSDEVLHRVRIALKKLRYCCELFAPLYGKPLSAFVTDLKDMQEALGVWNDWRVIGAHARGAAPDLPAKSAEGVGPLMEVLEREVAERLAEIGRRGEAFFSQGNSAAVEDLFRARTAVCCRDERLDPDRFDALYRED